ncbi:hypothetical protein BGZ80_003816 [Entomortierella chlamydospora]|uniref:Uncharacterized protein n=1 Tax=Entomortierella chlamydospora TaxID=101097 RepID=A0A9P6N0K7_9FUNG|nr:hypothetical protein BGZ79_010239 [Entomortierella chlamydospora]KAG0020664.1 hypothetical protein BGZ80_003816 [Entomortierella chlamydospora]
MSDLLDVSVDIFSDDNEYREVSDTREKMDDKIVKSIMEAIEKDDDSKVHLLTTPLWEINFVGSTSQMVFNMQVPMILDQFSPDDPIFTFLRDKTLKYAAKTSENDTAHQVKLILRNTPYSKKYVQENTRLKHIPKHDLEEMVKNVLTACNPSNPWYGMWTYSRDITRVYNPFNPTLYPGYFKARDLKDMIAVALGICNMQLSAKSVCSQDDFTKRFVIDFLPLSDLLDHKFTLKVSYKNDKFITYDGTTIKLRPLTHYDIKVLKYLIKHFDSDASRSIYLLLASMMQSEKDVRLAHEIGWFSGVPWEVFAEARQKEYQLPDEKCEYDAYLAIKDISKDNNNLAKGFARDFKYQSSTSPANIWIAIASLIFALVSVIQFFMGL